MNSGFWRKFNGKPIAVSAPMAGVSDAAFRAILAKVAKPDVVWTDMISVEGMAARGVEPFEKHLIYDEGERPIVAQLVGVTPENFYKGAKLIKEKGFDGVDINMGCPDVGVEKQGAGAALIKNPNLAKEIIAAVIDGAQGLPVSVKTRVGYAEDDEVDKWLPIAASMDIAAIVVHGRTRKEKRKGEADWDVLREGIKIIKSINPQIVVIGNGSVKSAEDGEEKCVYSGADGYMIASALIGNPWIFRRGYIPSMKDRLSVALEHTELFEKLMVKFGLGLDLMKYHYAGYFTEFSGAKEIRIKIMQTKSFDEAKGILREEILKNE